MTDDAGAINLGLESFKGFLGKGVQYGLGFVGTILFARILGPTSFGGYYTLLSLVYIADQPLRGISNAIEKRFSEIDPSQSEILGAVLTIYLVAFALVGVILTAFEDFIAAETNVNNAAVVFFVIFVTVPLFVAFQQVLSASGRPALRIWNDTLRSVVTFPLQLLFVVSGFGAAGMGYGLAGASLLTLPVAVFAIRLAPSIPSREVLRSIWEYAKYSVPGAMVATAYSRLDLILIGFILTTGAAGNYEIALKLTMPAILVTSAIAPALFPKISNLHSRGETIVSQVSNAIAYSSVIAIPIFFGAVAIPRSLVVTVYGGEYATAATLLIGLSLYQIIRTQVRMYARTMDGIDRPQMNLRISTVTLTVNVFLGVVLIYEYGALGVVIATVTAEFLRYLMYVFFIRRQLPDITVLPRPLIEQFVAGGVMYVVVEYANSRIPISGWKELVLVVAIGAGVYGAVLLTISSSLRLTLLSVYRDLAA